MSRIESKFYVINFLKNINLTPRAMKTHIQILKLQGKLEGRSYVQGL